MIQVFSYILDNPDNPDEPPLFSRRDLLFSLLISLLTGISDPNPFPAMLVLRLLSRLIEVDFHLQITFLNSYLLIRIIEWLGAPLTFHNVRSLPEKLRLKLAIINVLKTSVDPALPPGQMTPISLFHDNYTPTLREHFFSLSNVISIDLSAVIPGFTHKDEETEEENTEEHEPEEDSHLAFAKATIKHLGHRPEFAKKVKELKEMYNL